MSEEIKENENTNITSPENKETENNSDTKETAAPEKKEAENTVDANKTAASETNNKTESAQQSNRPPQRPDNRPRQRQNDQANKRQRFTRFRKKVCKFCHNKELPIDYKRPDILIRFLTDRGKILPRRITGTCAKHQRRVAAEVKRARMIALLPFVEK